MLTSIFTLQRTHTGSYQLTVCVPADSRFIAELNSLNAVAAVAPDPDATKAKVTLAPKVNHRRVEILLTPLVGALVSRRRKPCARLIKDVLSKTQISETCITLPESRRPDPLLAAALMNDRDILMVKRAKGNVIPIQVRAGAQWSSLEGRIREYLAHYVTRQK